MSETLKYGFHPIFSAGQSEVAVELNEVAEVMCKVLREIQAASDSPGFHKVISR